MVRQLIVLVICVMYFCGLEAEERPKVWVHKATLINPKRVKLSLKDELEGKRISLDRSVTEDSIQMHLALAGKGVNADRVFQFHFSPPPKEIKEGETFEIGIVGNLESQKGTCDTCEVTCPLFGYAQGGCINQAGTESTVNFAENLCWLGTRKVKTQKASQNSCSRAYRCQVETQKGFAGPFNTISISIIPQIYAGPGINYSWLAIEYLYELKKD